MATDILGMISEALGSDVVHKLSGMVGESQQDTQKALGAAVPAVLAGLAGQGSNGAGLSSLISTLTSGKIDGNLLGNIGSMMHGSSMSSITDTGRSLLQSSLGDRMGQVERLIASHAGVQMASAGTIMSMASALVTSALGKTMGSTPSVGALSSLLSSQKSAFMGALPSGLSGVLSAASIPAAVPAAAAAVQQASGGMGKMLGWLIAAIIIVGGIWYFMSGGAQKAVDTATQTTAAVTDAAKTATSAVGAALGEFFSRKLPNGVELNIPKLGIENRLVDFIEDSSKPADDTTWFDFDRLLFDTGKATLQPSSQEQLGNIANILKAYPKVKVRIGGYTDNTGDKAANLKLSNDRAANVMAELVKLGVEPARMDSKGYGDDHPVADNSTEEGRAKNRRISLRCTEK